MPDQYHGQDGESPSPQRGRGFVYHDTKIEQMGRGKRHHKGLPPIAQIEKAERQRRVPVYAEKVANGELLFEEGVMRVTLTGAEKMHVSYDQHQRTGFQGMQEFDCALKIIKEWLKHNYQTHMGSLIMWHWEKPVAIVEYGCDTHPDAESGYVTVRPIADSTGKEDRIMLEGR